MAATSSACSNCVPESLRTIGSGTGNGDYTNGRRRGDDLYRVEGIATIAQTAGLSGVMNGAYRAGDSSSLLPIDAIQEFSTEQNPKAQDGWKEGSTVSIGVKSGTNSLHGTAYAFGRDASATDAPNYFTGTGHPGHPRAIWGDGGWAAFSRTSSSGLRATRVCVTRWGTRPWTRSRRTSRRLRVRRHWVYDTQVGNCSASMVDACNDLKAPAKTINPLSAQWRA